MSLSYFIFYFRSSMLTSRDRLRPECINCIMDVIIGAFYYPGKAQVAFHRYQARSHSYSHLLYLKKKKIFIFIFYPLALLLLVPVRGRRSVGGKRESVSRVGHLVYTVSRPFVPVPSRAMGKRT